MSYSQMRAEAREALRGRWGTAVGMFLLLNVCVFLAAFLCIIPLIGAIGYFLLECALVMGYYIISLKIKRRQEVEVSDAFGGFKFFFKSVGLLVVMSVFIFLWTLLLVIPGIIASYRYSQAYYILVQNPEKGIMDCIQESKEMMIGHKMQLFILNLTFLGWLILSIFTFGIGYLFLIPYMQVTMAVFHDYVRGKQTTQFV